MIPEALAVLDLLGKYYWGDLVVASLGRRLPSGIKAPENWKRAIEARDNFTYEPKEASAVCMTVVTLGGYLRAGGELDIARA